MYQYLVQAIQPVHLEAISVVELTKILRDAANKQDMIRDTKKLRVHSMSLTQALAMAHALKEAHRLGFIRGQALRK